MSPCPKLVGSPGTCGEPLTGEQAGWVRVLPREPQQLTVVQPLQRCLSGGFLLRSPALGKGSPGSTVACAWGKPIPRVGDTQN